jgi:hypothetical protein
MNEQRVREEIERLGPWFHNIHLSDTIQTFPDHHFGDSPAGNGANLSRICPPICATARSSTLAATRDFTVSNWRGEAQESSVSMSIRTILPKLVGRPPF